MDSSEAITTRLRAEAMHNYYQRLMFVAPDAELDVIARHVHAFRIIANRPAAADALQGLALSNSQAALPFLRKL